MRTIQWYIDTAKARANIPSDNQLARALGINSSSVFHWKEGHAFPKTKYMAALARLCDVPESEALLDLMLWTDDDCRSIWQDVADTMKKSAAVILVALGITLFTTNNNPTHAASISQATQPAVFCILWRLR